MTAPVLRTLNAASAALGERLAALGAHGFDGAEPADRALLAIARTVAGAAIGAPNVAIAAILLNQVGGSYAIRHCVDSAALTALVARALGDNETAMVSATAAALTMNVGMLREIDRLNARATVLSSAERDAIRRHPQDGAALLRGAGIDDADWLACVLQHHETLDGSGYPAGLSQAAILRNALLVGMADRYCACVGARNYRRSLLAPAALRVLQADNAAHPLLVQAFVDLLGPCPPGTLVRLADGAVGVVSARGAGGLLAGVGAGADAVTVRVLRDADGAPVDQHRQVHSATLADSVLHEDEARLRFSMASVWGELAAL